MSPETAQQQVDRLSGGKPYAVTDGEPPYPRSDRYGTLGDAFRAQSIILNETGVMTTMWRMTAKGWVKHGTGPAIGSVNV